MSDPQPQDSAPRPVEAPGVDAIGPVKYDFSRPTGLSQKFKQNLTTIGESFAKQLGFNMANFLRSNVEVEFKAIEQTLFKDFVAEMENPACIGIFSVSPLKGQAAVSVGTGLMFVMLEKLIGGAGKAPSEKRDFTEIETRIFNSIFARFLGDFKEAARRTLDITPSFSRLESNPSYINIMTGGEKSIVMRLDMSIGEDSGGVSFCFPMSGFEPVMDKIDPKEDGVARTHKEVREDQEKIMLTLHDATIEVVVELGTARVSLDELLVLQVGDTLLLDQSAADPIPVRAGETTLFIGQPGKLRNRNAVKILGRPDTEV